MNSASWDEESATGSERGEGAGFDVIGLLWRRMWLIICGGLIGLSLGYLYFTKQVPIYESSSRVLVVRENTSLEIPIRGIGDTRIENDATATLLIRSPLIVGDAVKKHDLGQLPQFAGGGDPTGAIIGGLGVNIVGGNGKILDLTYRGTDQQSCATILKAVISSYQSFLGKTHENVNEETVRLITDAKDSLLKQLSEKETIYQQFRQDAPLLWNAKGDAAQNIHQSRLEEIEGIRSGLLISRTQTRAQIQAIEAALARGESREALSLMSGRYAGGDAARANAADSSPESQIFPLLLEEQMLLDNHGPDHPKVLSLQRRIALTRKYLSRSSDDGGEAESDEERKALPAQHQDFLAMYVTSLQQEIRTNQEKELALNTLFEEEKDAAKALAVFEVKDASYQADLRRTQQLFDGVVKRLEEINLMKNYGGFKTEVISPAGLGWQVEPNRNRILTLGFVAGLLGGLALAFLAELSDRTFRSPDDISAQLGLPIVGHIPFIQNDVKPKDSVSKLDKMLVTFFQPKSRLTEAYRAIRTALYFSTRGEKHKVIQITSPNPGDGKTTLSTNLAICIAQSGKTVVLIDADFRRPRIQKMLGVNSKCGMSSAILGEAELLDTIQSTEVENLFCIPCGPRPENPSELLTSHRFDEMLQVLREKFDFVLIDTPPVLAVTDPGTVAPRVDGVLITIRISKRTRSESIRATSLLKSLGANVLGVVVNGVSGQGGYGYGQYGSSRYYNYKYGYGYGYGYEYGDKNSVYYTDVSEVSSPVKQ